MNDITRTGIWNGIFIQPFLTLPDGSNWQLILFHYVDGGNNLFTQDNATDCNEFGLFSRLKWINNFTYDNKYEFYVIQDGVEHRWTQTSLPTASSPSGVTVITGNPVQGIANSNNGKTYLGYNSWWGACGCWTKYSTGGATGIPGFGHHDATGICTKYLALYARIQTPYVFLQRNGVSNQNQIYEY